MALRERITEDMKSAMRAGEKQRVGDEVTAEEARRSSTVNISQIPLREIVVIREPLSHYGGAKC